MTLEEVIIKESKNKVGQLYPVAKTASDNPDSGIVIKNKSAYYVIRDCAKIAREYIPIICYGNISDLSVLEGKFTKTQIKNFVKRTESNIATKQLLELILSDANVENANEDIAEFDEESDNIYGSYGYTPKDDTVEPKGMTDILCIIFKIN